jgi:hypothetical protein
MFLYGSLEERVPEKHPLRPVRAMVDAAMEARGAKSSGRSSRIDERTTRHEGYVLSPRKRKLVEQVFGWIKTTAGLRQTKHRGRERVSWMFTFAAAAYNLIRVRNIMEAAT